MKGPASPEIASDGLLDSRRDAASRPLLRFSAIDAILKIVLAGAVLGELGVVFFNILSRSFFQRPALWTDEAAELALSTIAFLGGAFAYRRGEHAFIRTLIDALPAEVGRGCYALIDLLTLGIAVTMGMSSGALLVAHWQEYTPILQMRGSWLALPLAASMVVIGLTAIERLVTHPRRIVLATAGCGAGLILALVLTRSAWQPWLAGDGVLVLTLVLFLWSVLIGLPIAFALLLGALVYLYASGTAPMITLAHSMVNGTGNFVLLAVPFFVFAAILMEQGGISLRLVRLVQALVGHFRGGLLQVMVVSMYLVSGLSGSKIADMAAVGSVMRDMLRRQGYSLERATAVLAASAAMGETVPPSIAMLVLGSITTLSVGALFIAGLMPAAVVAICLMALIYVQSRHAKAQRSPRVSVGELARATLGGVLPLLMPMMLLGGILLGVATPTEVSSFAVVYGLLLAGLIYRELGGEKFVRSVLDCAAISGMILFILAAASSFSWTLTVAYLPQRLVGFLGGVYHTHWPFLLGSMLLLIVIGSILEGLPALLILAPLLLPIADKIGVNQLHYGIVLIIAMGIGAFMPPVGAGFYVACAICETTIEKSAREMIPYLVVLCIGLVLVAFVPWFTLFLPGKFHLGG